MKETIDKIYYDKYVQQIKKDKHHTFIWQLIIFLMCVCLWELLSRFHIIDPLLFSSPSNIASLMYNKLMDGSMLQHTTITVIETIIGFLLGTVLGVVIAMVLWGSNKTAKIADPYLVIFNAMPKVALGPIIIVALGPGYTSIIMMGAIISVIITTLVVYSGFNDVDPNYARVLKSFGA